MLPRPIGVVTMWRSTAPAATLLISIIGGCTASEADDQDRPQLWTLFELRDALDSGETVAVTNKLPQGIKPQEVLAPGADGIATLKIIPAFSEGQPAAYVMPEIWAHFDEVWVQPWYVLRDRVGRQEPHPESRQDERRHERAAGLRRRAEEPVLQPALAAVFRGSARGGRSGGLHLR